MKRSGEAQFFARCDVSRVPCTCSLSFSAGMHCVAELHLTTDEQNKILSVGALPRFFFPALTANLRSVLFFSAGLTAIQNRVINFVVYSLFL